MLVIVCSSVSLAVDVDADVVVDYLSGWTVSLSLHLGIYLASPGWLCELKVSLTQSCCYRMLCKLDVPGDNYIVPTYHPAIVLFVLQWPIIAIDDITYTTLFSSIHGMARQ